MTCPSFSSTRAPDSVLACVSRSSQRFRPTPSRGHISERSWELSRRAAGLGALSGPSSAAGFSTSRGATTSRSLPPASPSQGQRWLHGLPLHHKLGRSFMLLLGEACDDARTDPSVYVSRLESLATRRLTRWGGGSVVWRAVRSQ